MDSRLIAALVVGLHCVAFIGAVSRFGNCWVYGRRDVPPKSKGYQLDCTVIKKVTYCHYYACPHIFDLDCMHLILRNNSVCLECYDKCVFEEEIYSVEPGARIYSKDNFNYCFCTKDGLLCSHMPVRDEYIFCEP